MWCAVERHLVQNKRRRNIPSAAKGLREILPQHKLHGNTRGGNMYMDNMAILKTDLDTKAMQAHG